MCALEQQRSVNEEQSAGLLQRKVKVVKDKRTVLGGVCHSLSTIEAFGHHTTPRKRIFHVFAGDSGLTGRSTDGWIPGWYLNQGQMERLACQLAQAPGEGASVIPTSPSIPYRASREVATFQRFKSCRSGSLKLCCGRLIGPCSH